MWYAHMECKLDHLDAWAGERTARWCGKGMIFKRFKDIYSIRRIRKKSNKHINRRYLHHWRIRNNFADDKCMPMLNIQKSPGGKSIECTNKLCLSIAWRKRWVYKNDEIFTKHWRFSLCKVVVAIHKINIKLLSLFVRKKLSMATI